MTHRKGGLLHCQENRRPICLAAPREIPDSRFFE
jgi:hypothetical protein